MNTFFQWTYAMLNPVLVGAVVPIPLMEYGVSIWTILLGYVVYSILWMLIWIKVLDNGRKLTLGAS